MLCATSYVGSMIWWIISNFLYILLDLEMLCATSYVGSTIWWIISKFLFLIKLFFSCVVLHVTVLLLWCMMCHLCYNAWCSFVFGFFLSHFF
uniref:Uncharacterized protein n=1 Tax=Arundo donax TaxID=35708 RepID=A0A0A9EFV4_ARUDO